MDHELELLARATPVEQQSPEERAALEALKIKCDELALEFRERPRARFRRSPLGALKLADDNGRKRGPEQRADSRTGNFSEKHVLSSTRT